MSGKRVGKYVLTFTDGHTFDFAVVGDPLLVKSWTPTVVEDPYELRVIRADTSWSFAPWSALTAVDWFPAGTEGA